MMNRQKLYQETVDLLLKRWTTDDLKHGSCESCAVGSICIKAAEKFYKEHDYNEGRIWFYSITHSSWGDLFMTSSDGDQEIGYDPTNKYHRQIRKMLTYTGYTYKELKRIERNFERSVMHTVGEQKRLKVGLLAVFKVLGDIHNTPQDTQQTNINRVNKLYKQKVS